jgi:hypothetical protein
LGTDGEPAAGGAFDDVVNTDDCGAGAFGQCSGYAPHPGCDLTVVEQGAAVDTQCIGDAVNDEQLGAAFREASEPHWILVGRRFGIHVVEALADRCPIDTER